MKIFLDECLDWRFSRHLIDHEVKTGHKMGWSTIKNGELLGLASEQFDIFLTVDRNLSFQQNLASFSIAVIVLCAPSNRLVDLEKLLPELFEKIPLAKTGETTWIGKNIETSQQ